MATHPTYTVALIWKIGIMLSYSVCGGGDSLGGGGFNRSIIL